MVFLPLAIKQPAEVYRQGSLCVTESFGGVLCACEVSEKLKHLYNMQYKTESNSHLDSAKCNKKVRINLVLNTIFDRSNLQVRASPSSDIMKHGSDRHKQI